MQELINYSEFKRNIISSTFSQLRPMLGDLFLAHWLGICIFFGVIIVGVILQIAMLRSGGHSKLSAGFNSLVGSITYSIFFLIYFGVGYLIFGVRAIDEIWLTVFGLLAFPSTGFFLRIIGFWYY